MASKSPDPPDVEALQRQIAELQGKLAAAQQANVTGSGAAAQRGGDALGERAARVEDNYGTIVTGTQIVSHYHAPAVARLSRDQIARQVVGYLRWLRARTESIELRGIERAGGAAVVRLPLETAYVPLRARSAPRIGDPLDGNPGKHGNGRTGRDRPSDAKFAGREADIGLNEVLQLGNRLVIIGGPGSGKTTVMSHMAWALASSLLTGQPEPARSHLGLSIAPSALPLPLFVPLPSFARYLRGLPGNASAREKTLGHFISYHLISKQADFDLPVDFFVQLLGDGRNVLLLLDGLDEVANEDERAVVRQSVEDLVHGRKDMRVVVTCRTLAYRTGRTALGADFREIAVQPLNYKQHIAPMVRQAYACIHPLDAGLRDDRVEDLLEGIQQLEQERRARLGKDADTLVDSPLMVRLLLIVHMNNRTLPAERADLFDKAINALLQVDCALEEGDRRELSTEWKRYRDMAQHLALHLHQQGRDQGREIEEPALRKALSEEAEFRPLVEGFLTHARQRGSVLEERDGAYRFIHLAFQEFLVARYLSEVTGRESWEAILAYLDERLVDPWWREPILLLAGYMAANAAKSARSFIKALARGGTRPNARFSSAELAGTAALEWRESGEAIGADCAQRIVTLLRDTTAVMGSEPAVRVRAGDVLARLGDPRFDRARFHLPADDLLGFVHIPADPDFRIGTPQADAPRVAKMIGRRVPIDEINDALTPTPEFYVGRYPVTVAQFKAFVDATGFAIGENASLRDPASRPVCDVSWHEALAYCQWLNEVLATSPALEGCEVARLVREGPWRVTLPSELEWEIAARGGLRDAVFPWGGEPDANFANYAETNLNTSSAVGCFAANGLGLCDMVGNVWEWTRSLKAAYPYSADDGRESLDGRNGARVARAARVVRGGAWYSHRGSARCAYRGGNVPDLRLYYFGFRVVLRSAPVS